MLLLLRTTLMRSRAVDVGGYTIVRPCCMIMYYSKRAALRSDRFGQTAMPFVPPSAKGSSEAKTTHQHVTISMLSLVSLLAASRCWTTQRLEQRLRAAKTLHHDIFIPICDQQSLRDMPPIRTAAREYRLKSSEELHDKAVYRPLQGDDIRVLTLHPGSDLAPVKCSLRTVSLSDIDRTQFEAISYVWGDSKLRAGIQLDSRKVNVPLNTFKALHAVRLPRRPRVLWIDALCINQDDLDERNQQVALMCQIYRASIRNLICLGDEDPMTRRAFATVDLIACEAEVARMEESKIMKKECDFVDILWPNGINREYADEPLQCKPDLEALRWLLQLPWFT